MSPYRGPSPDPEPPADRSGDDVREHDDDRPHPGTVPPGDTHQVADQETRSDDMSSEDTTDRQQPAAGSGFLPAPVPVGTDDPPGSADAGTAPPDAPLAVVTSGMAADDDPDVLEPTQIMPPIAARAQAGPYGPAPGPGNPDQPWGPNGQAGGYSIPGPPPYGQPPPPGYAAPPGSGYPGMEGAPPYGMPGGVSGGGVGRRRLLMAGGTLAALVVVGAGSFFGVRALTSGQSHQPPPAATRHTPSAGQSSAPANQPPPDGGIDSIRTDGKPMTVAEAFPSTDVTVGGETFTRVRGDVVENCSDAAKGGFAKALRDAGCDRVVAATFVDKHKKYAVTSGIAALPSKEAATKANRAADSRRGSWFTGLAGKRGSGAEKIDKAGGYAASLVWGRYIVYTYATYSDGHTPKTKDAHLSRLSQDFRHAATQAIAKRASS